MRLIDADALKTREILDALRSADFDDEIEVIIDNIPTAYDVEVKVVELEELADYNGNAYLDCADVIEIVRFCKS